MKRKQVKKFWIRNISKNREKFGAFIHCLESLGRVLNIFSIVFLSSCNNAVQIRKAEL